MPESAPRPAREQASAPERQRLRNRLFTLRAAAMLWRNTVSSTAAFLVGLGVLWLLVERLAVDEYLATAASFAVTSALHYTLGRAWIFAGTTRTVGAGYLFFLVNAGMGLVLTLALFALFFDVAGMHYIAARIVASVFAGLAMFVSNAVLNFKSL